MFESTIERVSGYFRKILEGGERMYYKIDAYFRHSIVDIYISHPVDEMRDSDQKYRISLLNEPEEGSRLLIGISAHEEGTDEFDESYFSMDELSMEDFIEFLKDHKEELRELNFKERHRMRQIRTKNKENKK